MIAGRHNIIISCLAHIDQPLPFPARHPGCNDLEKGCSLTYGEAMSSRSTCAFPDCNHRRFAERDFCLQHTPDALALQTEFTGMIIRESLLRDLSLPAITLEGIDFSHKTLMNCDFHGATLRNCSFNSTKMTFCMFDHARFENIKVKESKFLESIFACSQFNTSDFFESDIIQCNFNGCEFQASSFHADDLMYSRFLDSHSTDLIFEDCNLKAVYFTKSGSETIGFQFSNREDAFFL